MKIPSKYSMSMRVREENGWLEFRSADPGKYRVDMLIIPGEFALLLGSAGIDPVFTKR
jgi:hypothetical protein